MMRRRTMKFSQDWKKLDDRLFTTVRLHKTDAKYSVGEEIDVQGPRKRFRATVLYSCDLKLGKVPMKFLEYDLESKSGERRQDLMNKLGKLYGWLDPPDDSDSITIYLLLRD